MELQAPELSHQYTISLPKRSTFARSMSLPCRKGGCNVCTLVQFSICPLIFISLSHKDAIIRDAGINGCVHYN